MTDPIIDTHAHLQLDHFDADRADTIQRAREAGLVAIIVVATDVASSRQAIALAEQYDLIYAAVGIHPNDCAEVGDDDFEQVEQMLTHPKVVAVGEIGLDYYWNKASAEQQQKTFVRQLQFAREHQLPVIIHNREAGADLLQMIEAQGIQDWCGVFHCFAEDQDYAARVLQRGFHISFTGNLTYKKSSLPEIARHVPLERLLLETDCPFMTPVPHRGKRNEPAYTVHLAAKLAEVIGVPLAELCRRTTENAKRLFGLAN